MAPYGRRTASGPGSACCRSSTDRRRWRPAPHDYRESDMRVLLTGAFGNIGRSALDELLKQQHTVTCLVRPARKNRGIARGLRPFVDADRLGIVWGDVRAMDDVARAVADQDVVLHNAAFIPPYSEVYPEVTRAT